MLETATAYGLIELLWMKYGCQVQLPEPLARDFFDRKGPLTTKYDERRQHMRFHLRGRAVLVREGRPQPMYTLDLSRSGVRFLYFEQMMPEEKVALLLPAELGLHLSVRWCRRVDARCFVCGAKVLEKVAARSLLPKNFDVEEDA